MSKDLSQPGSYGGIPTGRVNIVGMMSVYGGIPELMPLSFTLIPEPSSLALLGLGLVLCSRLRRRN